MSKEKSFQISYAISKKTDRVQISDFTNKIEDSTGIANIGNKLEIIISELISNSIKMNLRRLYFQSKGFSFENLENYKLGLENFKLNYNHLNFIHYEKALKLLGIKLEISVNHTSKSISIYVKTNNNMSKVEEELIRKKLSEIMTNEKDMVDLYIYYGDQIDEESLGLAMTVDILRKMNFNPSLFRIYNEDKYTIARIELPLSEDYKDLRRN